MEKNLFKSLLLGASLLCGYSAQADDVPMLYGSLIYESGWASATNPPYGIYSIPAQTGGTLSLVKQDANLCANGGGVYVDGRYYMVGYTTDASGGVVDVSYRVFDVDDDWALLRTVEVGVNSIPTDLAYDRNTDRIYGCFYTSDGYCFGVLNRLTGEVRSLGALDEQLVALAVNKGGDIYGITVSGTLCRIKVSSDDKLTIEEIGSTGLTVRYAQSATFDLSTGKLYWSAAMYDSSKAGGLYEVDLANGTVTNIVSYANGAEVTGLYTTSMPSSDIPAKAENISYNYPNGSLNGSVAFTLPSTTVGGQTLTGDVAYRIHYDEGDLVDSGTGRPGQSVSVTRAFTEAAGHVVAITCSNSAGDGAVAVDYPFIGHDKAVVENLRIVKDGNAVSLSWNAPAEGVNGGYIDASNLTYKVVKYPEKTVVYEGGNSNYSETINTAELAAIRYGVTVSDGTTTGEETYSDYVKVGDACSIPYTENFNDNSVVNLYTIIDANGDGRSWNYSRGAMMYEYSESVNANDWLITPPLNLDPNYVYSLKFEAYPQDGSYTERLMVASGSEPTLGGMTEEIVMPEFEITGSEHSTHEGVVFAAKSGYTYVGFNVRSEANADYLTLTNIRIDELASVYAPDKVTDLKVVPDAEGNASATISFKLPTKAINGDMLTAVSEATLYRDGAFLRSFASNLTTGQTITYVDETVSIGQHTYSVVVSNNKGNGLQSAVDVYVGDDIPMPVSDFRLTDLGNGDIQLSWKAPTVGVNGGHVDASTLRYTIGNIGGVSSATEVVTGESYKDHVTIKEGQQQTVWYDIVASSDRGNSEKAYSDTLFIGDAYALPFAESFSRSTLQQGPWSLTSNGSSKWSVMTYGASIDPQDSDSGLIMFLPSERGGRAKMVSPKITLSGSVTPELRFWVGHNKTTNNKLTVKARKASGGDVELATIDQRDIETDSDLPEWVEHRIELPTELAQEDYVQLVFEAVCEDYNVVGSNSLALDNISIRSYYDYDLSVVEFTGGSQVKVGETIEFTVWVQNDGRNRAEGYTLDLYRDGKLVNSVEGTPLNAERGTLTTITDTPNADAAETSTYYVVINYDKDLVVDNNTSASLSVNVLPGLPYIDTLSGEIVEEGKGVLSWTAPVEVSDDDASSGEVTESFETYAPFTIANFGQWTLVDGDRSNTGGIINSSTGNYYEYANAESPMAYQVFNPSEAGITSRDWATHTGSQVLAAFVSTSKANDDWLISPEVEGGQTIKFWAKAPLCEWYETKETIEVLYSDKTTDTADFTKIGENIEVASETWTEYSFDIPEGAKYFAIHCISRNQYVLYIDDITYRPAGNDLALQGYNVYCNGAKINEAMLPASQLSYEVAYASDADAYQVSAVYNQGESILSNTVTFGDASVAGVAASPVKVIGRKGEVAIVDAAGEDVAIYSLSGVCVYVGEGDAEVALPQGIYLVNTGGSVRKVLVK